MKTICDYLLRGPQDNLNIFLQTQVNIKKDVDNVWIVSSAKSGRIYGSYDWVICTDRNSLRDNFNFQDCNLTSDFTEKMVLPITKFIQNVPIIATMISVDTSKLHKNHSLISFPIGMKVPKKYNSRLSWIAKSSSKPGQERTDGTDTWVLHSTSEYAASVIEQVSAIGGSFEEIRSGVTAAAQRPLLHSFVELLREHQARKSIHGNDVFPAHLTEFSDPVFIQTHRWGAAFPAVVRNLQEVLPAEFLRDGNGRALVDKPSGLIVVGDYFCPEKEGRGRIEGACLSAIAGANAIVASDSSYL
jgi:predicted NAD/FAD-dependent oxidoreductase